MDDYDRKTARIESFGIACFVVAAVCGIIFAIVSAVN